MSERDELTEIIGWTFQHAGSDTFKDCADVVLAAGYRKPRTITTVEELEALPDGSVVAIGMNAVKSGDVPWLLALQKEDGMWFSPATEGGAMSSEFTNSALPATVFYTPKETA